MAVSISRSGATVTVTITVDVTDLQSAGVSNTEKKRLSVKRALDQLGTSFSALDATDQQLDDQVTAFQADIAARKAARPSGSF